MRGCERGQEHRAFQSPVPGSGCVFAVDRGAGLLGGGGEARVGGEVGGPWQVRLAEAAVSRCPESLAEPLGLRLDSELAAGLLQDRAQLGAGELAGLSRARGGGQYEPGCLRAQALASGLEGGAESGEVAQVGAKLVAGLRAVPDGVCRGEREAMPDDLRGGRTDPGGRRPVSRPRSGRSRHRRTVLLLGRRAGLGSFPACRPRRR